MPAIEHPLRGSFAKGQTPPQHHTFTDIYSQNGARIPATVPRRATFRPGRVFPKLPLSSLLGVMMWVLFVCGSGVGRE